ncbi:MAG: ABC transporter substrate-binding protein [Lachnospirales bacterium]
MNKYFKMSDKVYDVTNKYPELINLFVENGFEKLENAKMRKTIGKTISIGMALKSKNIHSEIFEKKMISLIESNLKENNNGSNKKYFRIAGVLPCPIRMQLLETIEYWVSKQDKIIELDLQAASMGLDWLINEVEKNKDATNLPDAYLSAGFSMFFDKKLFGKYIENGTYKDLTLDIPFNPSLSNETINLRDTKSHYTVLGVVPAVFIVNTALLNDRDTPKSWEDLLKPEFKNSIAIPMKDLDMFNAILLGIYSKFGETGIKALGRNLLQSMHPAQMVKNTSKKSTNTAPLVSITPYFFAKMIKEGGDTMAIWPEDGAVISPILLVTKNKEELKPVVDFLFSKEVGEILSADSKFPVTQKDINNNLEDKSFLWPGWEFIHNNDISNLLEKMEKVFYESCGESI